MLHRVTIRLTAPLGTPVVSGTLFGHLCWAMVDLRGEEALADWLTAMETGRRPPFLLSDAFPAGFLPRPLMPPRWPEGDPPLERATKWKKARKAVLVRREDFLELRKGAPEAAWAEAAADASPPEPEEHRHAHNRIDRIRNTTPESAGIWFVDDLWYDGRDGRDRLDVYVDTDLDAALLRDLFTLVGENGYGRDITHGRGFFAVEELAPDGGLVAFEGNRLVSLSRGCLTDNMREPRYRRTTHYGKLAIRMNALTGRPWKKPILLTLPGASFRPADDGPFGRLLAGVHLDRPEIRFNAWHLAIPYREDAS